MEYKTKIFLLTFLAYMGVHSIRTSYSFSKKLIAGSIQVDDTQLGTAQPTQASWTPSCSTASPWATCSSPSCPSADHS